MAIYAFDEFEVDAACFELRRAGQPVAMEPQVFRILLHLVEARDRLVTKDDLFKHIWKGRIVSEAALSSRIKSLRQALGDDGSAQRYVRTLRGEGFRFVGAVSASDAQAVAPQPIAQVVSQVMARPMVGVFPFAFDRDEAGYLIDGLAEMLIAELAAWRWLPVTSRNATFCGPRDFASQMEKARALNMRYAVCGTVASREEMLRLTIELIDVAAQETLLTDIVEDSLDGMIEQQAGLAARILQLVAPEIEGAERRRIVRSPCSELSAWDLTVKALSALNQPSRSSLEAALGELDTSLRLDPGSPLAWSLKAQAYFEIGLNGWLGGEVIEARACFTQMLRAARSSIDLDPRGWMGHSLASAGELFAEAAYLPARYHAEQALRLNPSAGMAHHFSGCIVGFGGDPAEAIAIQQLVYAVDPNYRHATVIEADLGLWHFLLDDMEQALSHLDAALKYNPGNQRALQRRVAVHARLGDHTGARADLAALRAQGMIITRDGIAASYPFQNVAHGQKLADAIFASGIAIPD